MVGLYVVVVSFCPRVSIRHGVKRAKRTVNILSPVTT